MSDSINDKLYLLELENVELEVTTESYNNKITKLNKIIENTLGDKGGGNASGKSLFVITYSKEEVKALYKEIDENEFIVKMARAKHKAAIKRIRELTESLKEKMYWTILFSAIGFNFSWWGFYFWYVRVQKPIDNKVRSGVIET
ncbi:MAG: chaperonin cofactor prefoldin [Alteromonadaceae bacterium]|jgi:chaperonin cofactor prefoldin